MLNSATILNFIVEIYCVDASLSSFIFVLCLLLQMFNALVVELLFISQMFTSAMVNGYRFKSTTSNYDI